MKNNLFKLTFLFTLFTTTFIAQNSAKNVLHLSGGSILVISSANLNYDFRIKQSENGFFKNYYANLKAGVFNINSGFAPGTSRSGITTGLGIVGLTGKGNKHFETILGASLLIETKIRFADDDTEEKEVRVIPDLSLGYRYQKANGFMFRVGVGLPNLIYLGFGYSF